MASLDKTRILCNKWAKEEGFTIEQSNLKLNIHNYRKTFQSEDTIKGYIHLSLNMAGAYFSVNLESQNHIKNLIVSNHCAGKSCSFSQITYSNLDQFYAEVLEQIHSYLQQCMILASEAYEQGCAIIQFLSNSGRDE